MTGTEVLAPVTPAPLLPMEPEQAAAMMSAYTELCRSILTPEDVIGIPGQQGGFVKRSGWSKLATYYSLSTEIIHKQTDRDAEGVPVRASAVVRAIHPNGRHAEGDGACALTEPRFRSASGRQKAEHDVTATAVTRATNRAISNLIGFGAVSAEEVDDEAAQPAGRPFGPAASKAEEDGLLRALEDLGSSAQPANRLMTYAGGYMPRIGALAVMFVAAQLRDRAEAAAARMATEERGGNGTNPEAETEPEAEADATEEEPGDG